VPLETIAEGLATYTPLGHRGAVLRIGGLTVLADCYNANPESFRAAIAQCRDLYPERRLAAFVGSMLELGEAAAAAHEAVGRELLAAGFEAVAATGAFADALAALPRSEREGRVWTGATPEDVWRPFSDSLRGDEVLLVKASRGARLERVLAWLQECFGTDDHPVVEGRT
jgi:UDP-N-acetylmuramoyl-tripeptide--D-alanyl-D-alanine ligase